MIIFQFLVSMARWGGWKSILDTNVLCTFQQIITEKIFQLPEIYLVFLSLNHHWTTDFVSSSKKLLLLHQLLTAILVFISYYILVDETCGMQVFLRHCCTVEWWEQGNRQLRDWGRLGLRKCEKSTTASCEEQNSLRTNQAVPIKSALNPRNFGRSGEFYVKLSPLVYFFVEVVVS